MSKSKKNKSKAVGNTPTVETTSAKVPHSLPLVAIPPAVDAEPTSPTKQTLVTDLLSQTNGASLSDLTAATGWQKHSVRGFISGTLKKKLGLVVTSEPEPDRGRVYRIVSKAPAKTGEAA